MLGKECVFCWYSVHPTVQQVMVRLYHGKVYLACWNLSSDGSPRNSSKSQVSPFRFYRNSARPIMDRTVRVTRSDVNQLIRSITRRLRWNIWDLSLGQLDSGLVLWDSTATVPPALIFHFPAFLFILASHWTQLSTQVSYYLLSFSRGFAFWTVLNRYAFGTGYEPTAFGTVCTMSGHTYPWKGLTWCYQTLMCRRTKPGRCLQLYCTLVSGINSRPQQSHTLQWMVGMETGKKRDKFSYSRWYTIIFCSGCAAASAAIVGQSTSDLFDASGPDYDNASVSCSLSLGNTSRAQRPTVSFKQSRLDFRNSCSCMPQVRPRSSRSLYQRVTYSIYSTNMGHLSMMSLCPSDIDYKLSVFPLSYLPYQVSTGLPKATTI